MSYSPYVFSVCFFFTLSVIEDRKLYSFRRIPQPPLKEELVLRPQFANCVLEIQCLSYFSEEVRIYFDRSKFCHNSILKLTKKLFLLDAIDQLVFKTRAMKHLLAHISNFMATVPAQIQLAEYQPLDNNPNLSLSCKHCLQAMLGLHGLSPEAILFLSLLNKTRITQRVWVGGKDKKKEDQMAKRKMGGEVEGGKYQRNPVDLSKRDGGKSVHLSK